MKISQIINEHAAGNGMILTEAKSYKLWESAGKKLVEYKLTPDQIAQVFQQAEQGMTAQGGNRTMLGRGKDAVSAVNDAWEELKGEMQKSRPIRNVDALYDQAAAKLKSATGGDQGVMKYVTKYRDFAQKHPIAQSFIYAALAAAVGLSTAGLGAPAALGLLRMTDRMLQGDKFSSALYKGAKTGAMTLAAQQFRGADAGAATDNIGPLDKFDTGATDYVVRKGDTLSDIAKAHGVSVKDLMAANNGQAIPNGEHMTWNDPNPFSDVNAMGDQIPAGTGVGQDYSVAPKLTNPDVLKPGQHLRIPNVGTGSTYSGGIGTAGDTWDKIGKGSYDPSQISTNQARKWGLTESQIKALFVITTSESLNEGVWDWVKKKGHNMTTKITADKLNSRWEEEGSPTDSQAVRMLMIKMGIPAEVVDAAIKAVMKTSVPAAKTGATPRARATPRTTRKAAPKTGAVPAATTATPAAPPPAQPTSTVHRARAGNPNMAYSNPSATRDSSSNVMGNMASQLAAKADNSMTRSSTGGMTSRTSKGLKHQAKASNPNKEYELSESKLNSLLISGWNLSERKK